MRGPRWLVVARNEYRIRTSRIRRIRPYFPYLAIGILAIYVIFIAPRLFSPFIDDFLALIITQAAVPMVQIILFMIFFYFMIIPITNTLREVQTEQLEIFLAAPIKPSDVLLGEFLGVMPLYAIAVTAIVGSFIALLAPLGLGWAQIVITITIFVLIFFSALWIGTVTAAVMRTRLGKTARGRDIGRALALVIAFPIVVLMYALMGGGLVQALMNPETSETVRTILNLLPSSWGAEIFVGFASNPGNISAGGFETLIRFGGLILYFVVALWLGAKATNRAYSLETISFVASRAKQDGVFYKTMKSLGGGKSFGTLLVSLFKDYGRRLENLSRILYMLGLLAILNIFLVEPSDLEGVLIMGAFMLPLLAAFVVGEVTLRGKDCLFIYKKAPSGVRRLVKARLLKGWLIVIPISVIVTAITSFISLGNNPIFVLINIGLVVLNVAATVVFVLGLFLLNPAFSDKSGNLWVNIMIAMQALPFGTFLIPLITLQRMFDFGLYETMFFVTVPLSWLVGIVFLYLGRRRLSRIE
ncbi:MAG: hypothetical protein JSV51_08255 [Candidatus Bathyarchaeota archaeon]|nr:MAG: hypothetical protein JSV51_08255 [Candidatus Bathyarchaeota archaeon]